jgi:hypothetical protein
MIANKFKSGVGSPNCRPRRARPSGSPTVPTYLRTPCIRDSATATFSRDYACFCSSLYPDFACYWFFAIHLRMSLRHKLRRCLWNCLNGGTGAVGSTAHRSCPSHSLHLACMKECWNQHERCTYLSAIAVKCKSSYSFTSQVTCSRPSNADFRTTLDFEWEVGITRPSKLIEDLDDTAFAAPHRLHEGRVCMQ